jgi:hypothetical protein
MRPQTLKFVAYAIRLYCRAPNHSIALTRFTQCVSINGFVMARILALCAGRRHDKKVCI